MNRVTRRMVFLLVTGLVAASFAVGLSAAGAQSSEGIETVTPVARDQDSDASPTPSSNLLRYYLGTVTNSGQDNGFAKTNTIELSDPHYGWKLGRFSVSGYTQVMEDSKHNPVFLKTVGDRVTLWFALEQDINCLNGNANLSISEDVNGYDEYFGIPRTNFGHGTLIIRKTDHHNNPQEPTVYTDYLSAKVAGADTEVELFEEGDYEIALDYEIKQSGLQLFGQELTNSYSNYRISFLFSVRNGHCMVYPFDAATRVELVNTAVTENGFYLDLAKSRYLDINVRRELLTEGANGLIEDTRFNRPAKDGDTYTDEGVYTITVSNRYTEQQTVKRIYVGRNAILKAYVATGLPIDQIEARVADGAQIADDGTFVTLAVQGSTVSTADVEETPTRPAVQSSGWIWVVAVSAVVGVTIAFIIRKQKTVKNRGTLSEEEQGDEDE